MRLKNHDYSSAGMYFITICTEDRQCLFGKIVNNKMKFNRVGRLINESWLKIPDLFTNVKLGVYQIMPNHLHGMLVLNGVVNYVGIETNSVTTAAKHKTIGDIIGTYKSKTTNEYIKNVKYRSWSPFNRRLWQKNYYDRVIKNGNSLRKIREYIVTNPENWDSDRNNPMNFKIM